MKIHPHDVPQGGRCTVCNYALEYSRGWYYCPKCTAKKVFEHIKATAKKKTPFTDDSRKIIEGRLESEATNE